MTIFTKRNSSHFSDALLREAEGLELLRNSLNKHNITELSIPSVMSVDQRQLVMESINHGIASSKQMELLGYGLANLHRIHTDRYGLEQDNYIGLNPQLNGFEEDWGEFFIQQRLSVQINFIKDRQIKSEFRNILEQAYSSLKAFLNGTCDQASLVHGDLWSGNVLFDSEKIWLIDPAVYYADREVDIAMTEMFGGFNACFYTAYQASYPLNSHYPLKKVIYNLYHYLNHFNLFGHSYLPACRKGMQAIREL